MDVNEELIQLYKELVDIYKKRLDAEIKINKYLNDVLDKIRKEQG
tara:strand:+ start:55 stop:189 length:135 start_codon:yes stop_codon:yes gene_type:complete